jgi:hypothetical protein
VRPQYAYPAAAAVVLAAVPGVRRLAYRLTLGRLRNPEVRVCVCPVPLWRSAWSGCVPAWECVAPRTIRGCPHARAAAAAAAAAAKRAHPQAVVAASEGKLASLATKSEEFAAESKKLQERAALAAEEMTRGYNKLK